MNQKVTNLEEATHFFIKNHVDSVVCVKDGEEKECDSFVMAREFYEEEV